MPLSPSIARLALLEVKLAKENIAECLGIISEARRAKGEIGHKAIAFII